MGQPVTTTRPYRFLYPQPEDNPRLVRLIELMRRAEDLLSDARCARPGPAYEARYRRCDARCYRRIKAVAGEFHGLEVGQWVQVGGTVYFRTPDVRPFGMRRAKGGCQP